MLRQGEKVGQPIILFRQANYDPALDWTVAFQGTVADFFAAGLVSPALALHYGCIPGTAAFPTCIFAVNDPAFENEYAPFGVDSGLCMGVAATAFNDEGVTLQPCGVSSKTVWVLDTYDQQFNFISAFKNGVPLINGSDTNFSCGDAGSGRRRRHGGCARRGNRIGGHAVVRPGLYQPVQLPVRHAHHADLHG